MTRHADIGHRIAAAALAGLRIWMLEQRVDTLEAKAELAESKLHTALAANGTNQQTITELERENAEWARMCGADLELAQQLVDQAARERDSARARLAEYQSQWRDLYGTDPEAAAWARTRIPDSIVDRLRRRAARGGDPNG